MGMRRGREGVQKPLAPTFEVGTNGTNTTLCVECTKEPWHL